MPARCASATTSAADMVAGRERTKAAFVVGFFVDVGAVFLSMLDHVLLGWLEVTTGSAPAQLGLVITTTDSFSCSHRDRAASFAVTRGHNSDASQDAVRSRAKSVREAAAERSTS